MKIFSFLLFLSISYLAFGKVVYTSPQGSGDETGRNWLNTCKGINDALSKASEGDQIWLLAGLYDDWFYAGAHSKVQASLSIIGGFDGSETDVSERDLNRSVSSLVCSRTLRNEGTSFFEIDQPHRYFIVDGLRVIYQENQYPSGFIWSNSTDLVIRNCSFYGKGMLANNIVGIINVDNANFTLISCKFQEINLVEPLVLGGDNPSVILSNCLLENCYTHFPCFRFAENKKSKFVVTNNSWINSGSSRNGVLWLPAVADGNQLCLMNNIFYNCYSKNDKDIVVYPIANYIGAKNTISHNACNFPLDVPSNLKIEDGGNEFDRSYHLLPSSRLVDAGAVDTLGLHIPVADLDGFSRIEHKRIDIGCYEYHAISLDFTFQNTCQPTIFTFTNASSFTSPIWDFGDGQTSSLASPSHTYSATGTYTVSLTATNSSGQTQKVSKTVSVYARPTAPVIKISGGR